MQKHHSFRPCLHVLVNLSALNLAKSRLILDEMCRLYGKFTSYLGRVLCKTRLIFSRINGPIVRVVAFAHANKPKRFFVSHMGTACAVH